jgi:predicted nucleic acid-binding protein
MTVCLDTGIFLQIFGRKQPFHPILRALLELLAQLHGNIRQVGPQFRFNVIATGPDDNKFCDCAIAAEANFVITEDNHFDVLKSAVYKPKLIKPDEFIRQHLSV